MSQLERQQKIIHTLKQLRPNESLSVKELAVMLYASESSVRRDVISLEKRGLVTHIYGGVMLPHYRNAVIPASIREGEHSSAKEQIAASAAALIKDGDTVLMDASSTTRRILQYLGDRKSLRIVTNNARLFSECENPDIRLYCTGGSYNERNHAFTGPDAEAYIQRIHADILFFSSEGLSHTGEITDVSEEETSIRRVMLSRADRKVFLCDASKIGITKFTTLCKLDEIDDVICDRPELIEEIRRSMTK